MLVRDRQDKQKLLICTNDNGVFQWRAIDGKKHYVEQNYTLNCYYSYTFLIKTYVQIWIYVYLCMYECIYT